MAPARGGGAATLLALFLGFLDADDLPALVGARGAVTGELSRGCFDVEEGDPDGVFALVNGDYGFGHGGREEVGVDRVADLWGEFQEGKGGLAIGIGGTVSVRLIGGGVRMGEYWL